MNKKLDVESLRNPFESNTEWRMRRSFIEVNADELPLDRLICLSNCYVNVEMYGCRYPELVMTQLRKLEKYIPEYVPLKKESSNKNEGTVIKTTSRKKGVQMMNFVKVSDEENSFASTDKPVGNQAFGETSEKTSQSILEDEITGGERMLINEKFQELSRKINQYKWKVQSKTMTPVELLYMVGSKCQMTLDNKIEPAKLETGGAGFACELFIDCILVTTGNGSKKKTAKENACQKAIDILSSSSLSIVENESGNLKVLNTDMSSIPESSPDIVCAKPVVKPHTKSENEMTMKSNSSVTIISLSSFTSETGSQPKDIMQGGQSHGQQPKRKRVEEETCSDLSQFILIYQEEAHILSKLQRIADFNKVKLDYRSEETDSGWQCETYFGSFKMANGIGKNEKEARINSAEKALIALKEVCWSLREKQSADTDEAAITKDDLLADLQVGGAALPDSNIGNMLLRKMGWTGGGVGKEGNKGIAEPIQVTQVVNRQGLGLTTAEGTPNDFYKKMEQFATDYIQSENQGDVVFSPEFTKQERAVIHKICERFKLKTISRGNGVNRYLTMGRKRNALQLFDYVMSKGGSTQKYEVIPPSAQSLSDEPADDE